MIKFSVIIPTYEKPELLGNTLRFLTRQHKYMSAMEVIVVDHGSQDDRARKVVESFKKDCNIRYLYLARSRESAHNASIPRNAGMAAAKGEILIFLDDDILVQENFLEEHGRYHEAADNLIVIGCRKFLDSKATGEITKDQIFSDIKPTPASGFQISDPREYLLNVFSYNMSNIENPWLFVYSFNMSVKRKGMLDRGVRFDENFQSWGLEDLELGYSLFTKGYKILINHKLNVYHQYHGQSGRKEKMLGQEINNIYFQKKHGFKVPIISEDSPSQNTGGAFKQWMVLFQRGGKAFILQDKFKSDILKGLIEKEMSQKNPPLIIVIDKAGSDLDLWVQLLEPEPGCFVMYYPDTGAGLENNKLLQGSNVEKIVV